MLINYQDFELLVGSDRRVRATSDQGEEAGELRLDRNEIQLALQLIRHASGNTSRRDAARSGVPTRSVNAALLKQLGAKLYEALFPGDVHAHLRATIAGAEAAGSGVRMRLIIEPPDFASLPWEFLYDDDTNAFLGNSTQTVLSRYIPVPMSRRDVRTGEPPLKVLVVISDPHDLTRLDVAEEERLLRAALAQHMAAGHVEIDVLDTATLRNINQKLREKPYNVFHFIGHGTFDGEEACVALVNQDHTARLVDDETFSNFFLGNRSLGLIVLNACQGAAMSAHQGFIGMAPHLVRRGLPAVIAMQYPVADSTAKLFADEFYRTLGLGWPVDAAVQTTRNAVSMEVGLDLPDFATPVLFMRAKDGVILTGLTQSE